MLVQSACHRSTAGLRRSRGQHADRLPRPTANLRREFKNHPACDIGTALASVSLLVPDGESGGGRHGRGNELFAAGPRPVALGNANGVLQALQVLGHHVACDILPCIERDRVSIDFRHDAAPLTASEQQCSCPGSVHPLIQAFRESLPGLREGSSSGPQPRAKCPSSCGSADTAPVQLDKVFSAVTNKLKLKYISKYYLVV